MTKGHPTPTTTGPEVEELLPLRLVGDFCSWQVRAEVHWVDGMCWGTPCSYHRLEVEPFILPNPGVEQVESQLVSWVKPCVWVPLAAWSCNHHG